METNIKKRKRLFFFGIAGILILAVIYAVSGNEPADPREARKQRIEKMFSHINGEHKGLTTLIKDKMVDPNSYEHAETNYFDTGTEIIVNQEFTHKNEFGARVKGFAKAKVDTVGNVIAIIEQR